MLKFWSIFHSQNLWYNFSRDSSFLQTPSQSLPEKWQNPSASVFRHNNMLSVYIFVYFEL